jgi:NADH-quinone oxidoreductase subunit L
MNNLIAFIPALPLMGFLILSLAGRHLSKKLIAWIGAGTVSAAAILTIIIALQFLQTPPSGNAYTQTLWQWIKTENFSCSINFRIDALSLIFVFIITFVGALIHIYSTAFMQHDRDYARFFASMNLFVCSMLILVMADNLLLMYLGWEVRPMQRNRLKTSRTQQAFYPSIHPF